MMEKHNKKPSLFGNITAASQLSRAVHRQEEKQQSCKDPTATSPGTRRLVDKKSQLRAWQDGERSDA